MTDRTPQKQNTVNKPITIEQHKGTYGMLGYRSATIATSEGRSYIAYPGSAHEERDRKKLISQSRDFMRNNSIYKGMIERMIDYIVGNGFELQLSGPSKKSVAVGEKLWNDWNKKPEIRNVLSGSECARMILRELVTAGDTSALKTNTGFIQLFEAEQMDSFKKHKGYKNGIKKNGVGKPEKFRLCPWGDYSVDIKNGKEFEADDVLFLTNPERPSQLRGVPACQASFPMLHRINDVCDSEAIAWQLLSRLALSVTREQGDQLGYAESTEDDQVSSTDEGQLSDRMVELAYAIIYHAKPGEKVEGVERNIPGMNFTESLRMFLRLLGLPLGLPLELILLDWTQSNYSQTRGVMIQAYDNFLGWQKKLEDFYYNPLFQWKLAAWKKGKLISSGVNFQVNWIKKEFPWIDQLKEATAYAAQVERGFITHNRVCKSLNTDRAEVVEQRKKEIIDAIQTTKSIEEQTGEKVDWRILAGLKSVPDKAQSVDTKNTKNEVNKNE